MASTNAQHHTPGSDDDGPSVAILITEDHIAVMDPPVQEVMLQLTDCVRTYLPDHGRTGYRCVEQSVQYGVLDIKGGLAFPAGLLPRVLALLAELNCRVTLDDRRRRGPRLRADREYLDRLDPRQRVLIGAIRREPLGQIEVRGPRDAIETCTTICRALPRVRIVLAVATCRQARDLWRKLESRLGETVGLAFAGVARKGDRILVGTLVGIPCDEAGRYDILLLPCGEEATGVLAQRMVARMDFRRVYACIEPRRRADRHVSLCLGAVAGPIIHAPDQPGAIANVVMVAVPPCVCSGGTTALTHKRALYWHHRARNERIAAVAKALVARDRKVLRRLGMLGHMARSAATEPGRVAVLVESTEHCRQLSPLLPGWTLCTMAAPDGTTARPGAGTSRNDNAAPKIITTIYAARHDIRVDVLIRATGTGWPLRIRGFPQPHAEDEPSNANLIDFDDIHEPHATNDTRRRMRDYRRQGLRILMAQPRDYADQLNARNPSDVRRADTSGVGPIPGSAQRPGRHSPTPSRFSGGRT